MSAGFNRLILGFDVTVGILLGKDVFCQNFILCAVATFWVMSLVGIYLVRASSQVVPSCTCNIKFNDGFVP